MSLSLDIVSERPEQIITCLVLSMTLAACGRLFVTPQPTQHPDPAVASHAIEAEQTFPMQVVVRDFDFSSASISENSSPLHRATDLLLRRSADDQRVEIARATSATLSEQAVKRLGKVGLIATRIPGDTDLSLPDNILLVTGRLIVVDEGNRLTAVTVGLGASESNLDTAVQCFGWRMANGLKSSRSLLMLIVERCQGWQHRWGLDSFSSVPSP